MRNLKRALSLAMASIMILGMMVIGAGAVNLDDFTDKDKIVNQEAVVVLTTLGVLAGREDKSFDPEGTVTRGEMAKMLCVILNGGKDPQLGESVKNSYTDTVGHWASGYIEYCTTSGIIAGRNDGTFDPNGTVTVAEAGKMLLVALGYNASVEGYTGANWQINTDVRANAVGLYDELGTLNTNVSLTRDNAAQICYNALDQKIVEYDYVITGSADNSISTKPQLNESKRGTLLFDKFGAIKLSGVVIANEFANLNGTKFNTDKAPAGVNIGTSLDADRTTVLVTNFEDGQTSFKNQEYTFAMPTGEAELGMLINVYVKPENTSLKSKIIGSAMISDENNVIIDTSGDSTKAVADDNNLNLDGNTKYAYNYAGMNSAIPAHKDGLKGIEKILVDINGDNKVDYVLYNELRLGKVTLYSEAKKGQVVVTVGGATTGNYVNDNKENILGFENVKKDDMVLTAYIGGRMHVQLAEMISGTINAYKQTKDTVATTGYRNTGFTVDETAYDVSRVDSYKGGDINVATTSVDKTILASKATFYLDVNGFVVAYGDVNETAYKYAYIWAATAGNGVRSDEVKATLEDGTTRTYYLNTNSDINVLNHTSDHGREQAATTNTKTLICEENMSKQVFAYTITSNSEIKLYLPKNGTVENTTEYPRFNKGLTAIQFDAVAKSIPLLKPVTLAKDTIVSENTTYYSNNATTFFYVSYENNNSTNPIDRVSVYNGRNTAPSLDGAHGTAKLALHSNGDVGSAVFDNVVASESAGDHMFVYNANYVWSDFGYVDAFLNGKTEADKAIKAALRQGDEIVHNPDVANGLYLYKLNGDGYYEISKPTNETYYFSGTVARVNKANNTFVITSNGQTTGTFTQEFQLTKDSIVIDYDSSHSSPIAVAAGSVSEGDSLEVIVNNQKDSQVLMAGIMSRNNTGNVGTGPIVNWDGVSQPTGTTKVNLTGDPATDKANILAVFAAGSNVFINGSMGSGALTGHLINIPANRAFYITGNFDTNNIANNVTGTLMVGGSLSGSAPLGAISTAKTSVLGVIGNWTTDDATTVKGAVTVTGKITLGADLTVDTDSVLKAGSLDTGAKLFTVSGHAEVAGNQVGTGGVVVDSDKTLVVGGNLTAGSLTIGNATNAGKVQSGSINVTNTIEIVNGDVSTRTDLTAGTLTVTPATGKKVSVTVGGGANVTAAISVGTGTTLSVAGRLKATGGLSITDSANVNIKAVEGSVDISGKPSVSIPEVDGALKDTSTGGSVSAGTDKDSVITLAKDTTISKDTVYTGEVKITGAVTIKDGVTVTFSGKVTGIDFLTASSAGKDKLVKVTFGGKSSINDALLSSKFVSNDETAHPATLKNLPGTTFQWDGTKFVAISGNAYYIIAPKTTAAIDSSANLYI